MERAITKYEIYKYMYKICDINILSVQNMYLSIISTSNSYLNKRILSVIHLMA